MNTFPPSVSTPANSPSASPPATAAPSRSPSQASAPTASACSAGRRSAWSARWCCCGLRWQPRCASARHSGSSAPSVSGGAPLYPPGQPIHCRRRHHRHGIVAGLRALAFRRVRRRRRPHARGRVRRGGLPRLAGLGLAVPAREPFWGFGRFRSTDMAFPQVATAVYEESSQDHRLFAPDSRFSASGFAKTPGRANLMQEFGVRPAYHHASKPFKACA